VAGNVSDFGPDMVDDSAANGPEFARGKTECVEAIMHLRVIADTHGERVRGDLAQHTRR